MSNESITNSYLSKAVLKGFRTIKDVEIDFQPGLNIIIGKNGAGKTNFINFLSQVLNYDYKNLVQFDSILEFTNNSKVRIEASNKILIDKLPSDEKVISTLESIPKIYINNVLVGIKDDRHENVISKLFNENKLPVSNSLIHHGIPYSNLFLIDSPLTITFEEHGGANDIFSKIMDLETPYFIQSILASLSFFTIEIKHTTEESKVREEIAVEITKSINLILSQVQKYSPIKDIKVNSNFNISYDNDKKNVAVSNLYLEFKINNSWLPFSSLSDGTKRVFCIIAEVCTPGIYYVFKNSFTMTTRILSRVILIEEPELGIYPHQLHKLMLFLKSQSKQKQIILTTHSPDVLDILEKDELNKIIVCNFSGDKQTQLRHLTEKEMIKAKKYIEDEFLSDYWKFSDLEK